MRATLLGTLASETAQQRRPQPKRTGRAAASDEVPGQRRREVSRPTRISPGPGRSAARGETVPPEGVNRGGAVVPGRTCDVQNCARLFPSGTKACRNSPATSMPPICSPMFFDRRRAGLFRLARSVRQRHRPEALANAGPGVADLLLERGRPRWPRRRRCEPSATICCPGEGGHVDDGIRFDSAAGAIVGHHQAAFGVGVNTSTVEPFRMVMTSPGRWAVPLGMFSRRRGGR